LGYNVTPLLKLYRLLTMFSALAAVCTVWLRYRNWLNYITLHYTKEKRLSYFSVAR